MERKKGGAKTKEGRVYSIQIRACNICVGKHVEEMAKMEQRGRGWENESTISGTRLSMFNVSRYH